MTSLWATRVVFVVALVQVRRSTSDFLFSASAEAITYYESAVVVDGRHLVVRPCCVGMGSS